MQERIKMNMPLVEMDGDEMTRVIWKWVKELLIEPFVELKTEYYDLGLENREKTRDGITLDAAKATAKLGVGVKCATITPNEERQKEYSLSEIYKSPNGTLRAFLDGTVFRAPIVAAGIPPYIRSWKRPITIARHAYGDIYKNTETKVAQGAKAELVITDGNSETRQTIYDFSESAGVVQGIHNTDASIESFARACMEYALGTKQDLWFGAKDTISKTYDRRFRDIFAEVFEKDYKGKFAGAGIAYNYSLIDDVIARVVRSEGGFVWACKNYDGDVMSDMVAAAFGSLAMMTSVLASPAGVYEFEAAHGTVQRHYYKHIKGEKTSTNPVATIFAWSGALKKRGELDSLPRLVNFADALEAAVLKTIENGTMTGDLLAISTLENKRGVSTQEFLQAVAAELKTKTL